MILVHARRNNETYGECELGAITGQREEENEKEEEQENVWKLRREVLGV